MDAPQSDGPKDQTRPNQAMQDVNSNSGLHPCLAELKVLSIPERISAVTNILQVIIGLGVVASISLTCSQTKTTEQALVSSSRAVTSAQIFELEKTLLDSPKSSQWLSDNNIIPDSIEGLIERDHLADMVLITLESVWLQSDFHPELKERREWCQWGSYAYSKSAPGSYVFERLMQTADQFSPDFIEWVESYPQNCNSKTAN
jgi:hypothetical protein